MTVSELELQEPQQAQIRTKKLFSPLILIGFSIFYFTNVLIRASEKYFWFDELVTLYMLRLPNLHAIEQALAHRVDFNPLFFYILSGWSRSLFGENLLGMRMPQIVGFWVLCVCLFRFVSRRAGPLAGLIAMVLPTTTGAFFYAYEARAHGIVLGFCGIALACWQMTLEEPRKSRWLFGLSLGVLGAALTHCYGLLIVVPFSIAEIFQTVQKRRINWRMWLALVVPSLIAVAAYIPLLRTYTSMFGGTSFTSIFPASVSQITGFYIFLLAPAIVIILTGLTVLAAGSWIGSRLPDKDGRQRAVSAPELVVAVSFLLLPIFGLLVALIVHSPFMARYFLSSVVGVCILIGIGVGTVTRRQWPAIALAAVMAFSVGWPFLALLWHRYHGRGEDLFEPSTSLFLETTPGNPISKHALVSNDARKSLPIVVPRGLEFVYLTHYAPALRSRLYYVSLSKDDFDIRGLRTFREWCPTEYNPERVYDEFVKSFPRFLVYGDPAVLKEFSQLAKAGGTVKSIQVLDGHFLAEIER